MDFDSGANDFAGEVGASQEQKLTAKFAKDSAKDAKKNWRRPKMELGHKVFFAPFAESFAPFAVKCFSSTVPS
jgi:hypothetical protein